MNQPLTQVPRKQERRIFAFPDEVVGLWTSTLAYGGKQTAGAVAVHEHTHKMYYDNQSSDYRMRF